MDPPSPHQSDDSRDGEDLTIVFDNTDSGPGAVTGSTLNGGAPGTPSMLSVRVTGTGVNRRIEIRRSRGRIIVSPLSAPPNYPEPQAAITEQHTPLFHPMPRYESPHTPPMPRTPVPRTPVREHQQGTRIVRYSPVLGQSGARRQATDPIRWAVRTSSGRLRTGWMFSRPIAAPRHSHNEPAFHARGLYSPWLPRDWVNGDRMRRFMRLRTDYELLQGSIGVAMPSPTVQEGVRRALCQRLRRYSDADSDADSDEEVE